MTMYKIEYSDTVGCPEDITEFTTEAEAEKAIDEEMEMLKDQYKYCDYDYADFGPITELWISNTNISHSWKRLWK